jgi:hypothetical protein
LVLLFICSWIKKGRRPRRGFKEVTLETIMSTKADKTVQKITHHVIMGMIHGLVFTSHLQDDLYQ